MALRYEYSPPLKAGGAPRPMIDVVMCGPRDTKELSFLIDSGADHNYVDESWADILGIDLSAGEGVDVYGHDGRMISVKFHLENYEWYGNTIFLPTAALRESKYLLGGIGFFDSWDVHFKQDSNAFLIYPVHAHEVDPIELTVR